MKTTENTNIIYRNIVEAEKEKIALAYHISAVLSISYASMTYENVSTIKLFLFIVTK